MTEALILFMKRRILSIFESLWKNNKDTHTNQQSQTGIFIFPKQILLSMNWCWKFLSTQKSKFPRRKDLCRRLCWKLVCIGNSDYQSSYSSEKKRKKLLQNRKKFLLDDNSQAKLNWIKCTYREASITFKIQIFPSWV